MNGKNPFFINLQTNRIATPSVKPAALPKQYVVVDQANGIGSFNGNGTITYHNTLTRNLQVKSHK